MPLLTQDSEEHHSNDNRPNASDVTVPYRDNIDMEDHDVERSDRPAFLGPDTSKAPSSSTNRFTRRIPLRLVRIWDATSLWVKGPDPPRPFQIHAIFPFIQHAPLKLLDRIAPKQPQKIVLLILYCLSWLACFSVVQWKSSFASEIPGYGSPMRLSCVVSVWADGDGCGINGDGCRPFANSSLAFRCPANCASKQTYSKHAVGTTEVIYRNLVIGGSPNGSTSIESAFYRGDSFICGSAVHAGFISDRTGGCGVLELIGEQMNFPSTSSHRINSIGFDSYFPLSYRFKPGTQRQCQDLRWPTLIVSSIFTAILALSTTSPKVFFTVTFVILYATTNLATDPPTYSNYYELVSGAFAKFLPACFAMYAMYIFAVRRTLTNLDAQVEKAFLWLGAAWVGALNNFTFDKIPLQRLTPHDIKAQPGAIPALIVVVLAIFAIALWQAWCFRIEGRAPRMLGLYAVLGGGLLCCLAIPKMNLRIHHYILALLLLPGTSMQTRVSLAAQGLLVGLFVNGIARWGWASILQTPAQLFADDNIGSLLPVITTPIIAVLNNTITFTLGPLPIRPDDGRSYDGISVLVNDVERIVAYSDGLDNSVWTNNVNGTRDWTWTRHVDNLPEYFRFAYMMGSTAADYTQAGTWLPDGTWKQMASGPS